MLEKVSVIEAKTRFCEGNLNYEIVVQNYCSIFCCGEFDCKFKDISFKDIRSKNGLKRLRAYLKDQFTRRSDKNDNEILGVVTDGEHKLDVVVNKNEEDETPEYERLRFAGRWLIEIHEINTNKYLFWRSRSHWNILISGITYILKVKGTDKIKELSGSKMELEKLILANEIFVIGDV
ncbi:hypothetical protein QAD02_020919 [Eretmocerus hayati]|uniref:Uncharacterized protein n=1 Tax=Eretmocerus hayati TaxID=131215 RepID=A0ACC2PQ28_9HYME|nr:hypothetical protein QAD02_020919 [Eretmocerus hayati]